MKRFKGQKIQEDTDFMRIPSLTLTPDEVDTIPDPPSFEDFAVNSRESFEDPLSIRKNGNRTISKGKLSKTIRFQHRLSSLASVYSSNSHDEVGVAEKVEMRTSSVKVRKFTPTMNKLIEENQSIQNFHSNSPLHLYPAQVQQPAFVEPVMMNTPDILYGDDVHEEEQILNQRLASGNHTTETFKTTNELLINEIVDSYKNNYMDVVDQYYKPSDKIAINLPLKIQDKSLFLHPPTPMLNRNHQHTTSIHTVSDMSTLPEKLFSSPEIENRSSASSVYSEISDTEYTDEDEEIKRETIHKNIYSSEIPDLSNVMNIIDEYDDDNYVIGVEENVEWMVNSVKQVNVLKPKMLQWDEDFDSSDDDDGDIISVAENRIVSAISGNNYTYMRHLEYVDDSSSYDDDILSEYSERTSFTTNTTTTFNSRDFYEAHDYVEISIERE